MSQRRVRALGALVAVVSSSILLGVAPSNALFTDAENAPASAFNADVLASPSGLTVERSGTALVLSWSPTASTYADGYKVYRSAASAGPWTEVATVNGRLTTTWSDTTAPAGTSYYQVKAYRVNWLSGTTNVSEGSNTVSMSDTFSGSGALGATESGGGAWTDLVGAWSRSGGDALSSVSYSSNPLSVIETGVSNVDARILTPSGYGQALYFRVVDANDWLRARNRHYTSTGSYQQPYTYYVTEYRYVCYPRSGVYPGHPDHFWAYSVWTSGGAPSCPSGGHAEGPFESRQSAYTGYNTVYYTNYYYEVVLQKSVNGTVTTLATYSLGSAPSSIRVVASGSTIQTYNGTTLLGTVTDATHSTATRHGIGLGGPTSSAVNRVGDFTLTEVP